MTHFKLSLFNCGYWARLHGHWFKDICCERVHHIIEDYASAFGHRLTSFSDFLQGPDDQQLMSRVTRVVDLICCVGDNT